MDFKNHFQAHHKINATSRSQRYTCGFYKSQFPKQNLFTHHIGEHLEDRYSLVKELQPEEFLNLSKISKQLRRERDQDLELLTAIEILEKSIENEDDDDTEKSVKDDTCHLKSFAPRCSNVSFVTSKGLYWTSRTIFKPSNRTSSSLWQVYLYRRSKSSN